MRRFGKPIMSVLVNAAFVVYLALAATSPGGAGITAVERVLIAVAAVQAVQTYIIPLAAQYPWTKTAAGATLAGLAIAVTALGDGWQSEDWFIVAFEVAAALGIAVAPAVSDNGVRARAGIGDAAGAYGSKYERGAASVPLTMAVAAVMVAAVGLFAIAAMPAGAGPVKPRPGTSQTPDFSSTYPPVPICDLD